jgi:hypothetical protein
VALYGIIIALTRPTNLRQRELRHVHKIVASRKTDFFDLFCLQFMLRAQNELRPEPILIRATISRDVAPSPIDVLSEQKMSINWQSPSPYLRESTGNPPANSKS